MRTFRCFFFLVISFFGCTALTPAATNHPKILIIYDMEGVSGVTNYEMLWVQRPDDYAKGRESLTSDVNAAIRGLVAGGAGPIWIQDRHGSGNVNEPDLLVDKMDQSASLTGCRCISRKSIRKREASAFGHARNAARDARMRRA